LARQAGAKTIKREAVAKTGFDVIINATPIGMATSGPSKAVALPLLQPEDLKARIVFDLVYNPLETPLLRLAHQKGLTVISGIEMFVQQGARQFEIWTGKPAPEEEMLRVVIHALRKEAGGANQEAAVPSRPTRIDIGPHAPASHADPEPAARAAARPSESQTRPAAKKQPAKPPARPAAVAAKPAPPSKNVKKSSSKKPVAASHKKTVAKSGSKPKPSAKAAAPKKAAKPAATKATAKSASKRKR
jgi:3-dehydroquinate dehydratase/shikimate dehydrogenase